MESSNGQPLENKSEPVCNIDDILETGGTFCKEPTCQEYEEFRKRVARLREVALSDRYFDSETYHIDGLCDNPPLYHLIGIGFPGKQEEFTEFPGDGPFQSDRDDTEGGILLQCYIAFDSVYTCGIRSFPFSRSPYGILKAELTEVLNHSYFPYSRRDRHMKTVLSRSMKYIENTSFHLHNGGAMSLEESLAKVEMDRDLEWVYQAFVVDFYLSKLADSRRFQDGFIEVAAQHKTKGNSKH